MMHTMISLIVNADDHGLNMQRDRGIIEAFERGIVTSSTMIANGTSFTTASAMAKDIGMPIGVHLNLSEEVTLTGPIIGLTDQDNRLPGKIRMREYLLDANIDRPGIRRELSAQIEKIFAAGLFPGHLDGHQHCHVYPSIAAIVVDLAKEYGIEAVRSVDPADTAVPKELDREISLFREMGKKAAQLFRSSGLKTTDGICGLAHLHDLAEGTLCNIMASLPCGHWELMTHPGYPSPGGKPFESEQRLTELRALCSEKTAASVAKHKIKLTTFGELPCASWLLFPNRIGSAVTGFRRCGFNRAWKNDTTRSF